MPQRPGQPSSLLDEIDAFLAEPQTSTRPPARLPSAAAPTSPSILDEIDAFLNEPERPQGSTNILNEVDAFLTEPERPSSAGIRPYLNRDAMAVAERPTLFPVSSHQPPGTGPGLSRRPPSAELPKPSAIDALGLRPAVSHVPTGPSFDDIVAAKNKQSLAGTLGLQSRTPAPAVDAAPSAPSPDAVQGPDLRPSVTTEETYQVDPFGVTGTPGAESPFDDLAHYGGNAARAVGAGAVRFNVGFWGVLQAASETMGLSSVAEFSKAAHDQAKEIAAGVRGTQAGAGPTEKAIYGGFESLGLTVPAIAAGLASGNPATTLSIMGGTTGGEAYAEARQKGAGVPQALSYATSQAVIEMATEKIPASRLLGDFAKRTGFMQTVMRQLGTEIPGEQLATILQDLNDWAVLHPDKPFASYLAERPSAAAATLISTLVATVGQTAATAAVSHLTSAGLEPMAPVASHEPTAAAPKAPPPETPRDTTTAVLDELATILDEEPPDEGAGPAPVERPPPPGPAPPAAPRDVAELSDEDLAAEIERELQAEAAAAATVPAETVADLPVPPSDVATFLDEERTLSSDVAASRQELIDHLTFRAQAAERAGNEAEWQRLTEEIARIESGADEQGIADLKTPSDVVKWLGKPQPPVTPKSSTGNAAAAVREAPASPTPGEFYTMAPEAITVDPARFQFKGGTNAEGVTSAAKIDGPWNEARAGVLMVWKDPADGLTYVINGHHRLEAAKRMGAERVAVRYLDAPDAKTARVEGALTNIAEDKGTPLDAAKLIRDAQFSIEKLQAHGLSTRSALLRDGMGLAQLSDPIFDKVVTGELDEKVGGAIGAAALSPEGQAAVVQLVERQQAKGRTLTPAQVRTLAEDVAATPEVASGGDGQADIFGLLGEERTQNVAVEKAVLRDWARQQLAQDKRLFGFVSKEGRAEKLAKGGNTIDVAASKALAEDAGQVAAVFDRLAQASGPVSSALNAAAVKMAEGTPAHEARAGLLDALRTAVAAELGRPVQPRADAGRAGSGAQVGAGAHRQRRAADSQTEVEAPREFASTQVDLPADVGRKIQALGAAIPDADLAEDGREDHSHVTVKFGLHADDPESLKALLKDEGPITVTLGKTSFFPNGESDSGDVLKVDVDSPDLHRLNAKIADALPHTDTHPTYRPHVTILYLKPGLGEKYAGDDTLAGTTITIDRIVFSGKDRQHIEIPLRGKPRAPVTAKASAPQKPSAPVVEKSAASAPGLIDKPSAPVTPKGEAKPKSAPMALPRESGPLTTWAEVKRDADERFARERAALITAYWVRWDDGVIDNDRAKWLVSPTYAESRENRVKYSLAVQDAAGRLSMALFRDGLARLPKDGRVRLVGGGPGAGKTTALRRLPGADLTLSASLSSEAAVEKMLTAIEAADGVAELIWVRRDPVEAWNAALDRSMGDEGRLPSLAFAVKATFGAAEAFQRVAERHPTVLVGVLDTSGGRDFVGPDAVAHAADFLATYNEADVTKALERTTDAARQAGRIDTATAAAAYAGGSSGADARDPQGDARERAEESRPASQGRVPSVAADKPSAPVTPKTASTKPSAPVTPKKSAEFGGLAFGERVVIPSQPAGQPSVGTLVGITDGKGHVIFNNGSERFVNADEIAGVLAYQSAEQRQANIERVTKPSAPVTTREDDRSSSDKPSAPVTSNGRSTTVRSLQHALSRPGVTADELPEIFRAAGQDFDTGILKMGRTDPRWSGEIKQLGQATSRPSEKAWQVRANGVAEFFRLFVTNPTQAKAAAPAYFDEFTARLGEHPQLRKTLQGAKVGPSRSATEGMPQRPPDPLRDDVRGAPAAMPIGMAEEVSTPTAATRGRAVSLPDVIASLGHVTAAAGKQIALRFGRVKGQRYGQWNPRTHVARTRAANDVPTATHEVAHAIQTLLWTNRAGRSPWVAPLASNPMQRELAALGRALYGDRVPVGGYKSEGWAEFVRMWVTESNLQGQPADLSRLAPITLEWFTQTFAADHPRVYDALEQTRALTRRWRSQGALARAKASVVDTGTLATRAQAIVRGARRLFTMPKLIDMAQPLSDLAREAETVLGRPLEPSEDPFLTTSALRTTHAARTKYMVDTAMIDLAGNRVGPPLAEIRSLVQGQREAFTLYLWAHRARALHDDPQGPRNPGLSRADAEQILRELQTPAFELAAGKVYAWNNGVLNYAAQASPTFAQVVENVRRRDPGHYVPLQRIFEELDDLWARSAGTSRGAASSRSPVKHLTGSGRQIKDIFPVMIGQTENTIRQAHQRLVLDQILTLSGLEGMGHLIEEVAPDQIPATARTVEDLLRQVNREVQRRDPSAVPIDLGAVDADVLASAITFFAPMARPKGQDPIVPIYDQGTVRWFHVDGPLYDTLSSLDVYRLPDIAGVPIAEWLLGKPAALFRAGTTGVRASFSLLWNPLKDVQTFMVNTRSRRGAAVNFAKFMRGLVGMGLSRTTVHTSAWVDAWVRLGGEMAQPLGQDIPHTRRAARQLFEGRVVRTLDPRNWFDFYRDLIQFPEGAGRVAELETVARQIGWQPGTPMTLDQSLQLLLASKQVTTDFSAAGEIARVVNRMVPFHNAAIQGPRANLRAARRNPALFAWRGLQITAITLLLWWQHKDDEWYAEMPYRERFLHWWFPITIDGRQELARIPRAFETGLIFAALPEMLMDAWYREEPAQVTAWFQTFFDVTTPPLMPVPINVAKEQWQNRQWPDRPIVPLSLARKPAAEQYTEYTSRAAVLLGRLFDVSPLRVEHAIRGTLGPVSMDLLTALDAGPDGATREEEPADWTIIGRLFQRGGELGTQPKPISDLYELAEQAQLRQHSDENPEDARGRQRRLQLEDATSAISALLTVRRYKAGVDERRTLTAEALAIANEALAAHAGDTVNRTRFAGLREKAELVKKAAEKPSAPVTPK